MPYARRIQCTPLLVEKAGVTPVVTFRITACKKESAGKISTLDLKPNEEGQNRSNQWLREMDLGPNQKLKKKAFYRAMVSKNKSYRY